MFSYAASCVADPPLSVPVVQEDGFLVCECEEDIANGAVGKKVKRPDGNTQMTTERDVTPLHKARPGSPAPIVYHTLSPPSLSERASCWQSRESIRLCQCDIDKRR